MPSLQKKEYKSLDEVGGKDKPLGGFYHVAITHWDETFTEKDQIVVDFQVLAGTTPKQEGKVHREYISMKKANGSDNSENFEATTRRLLVACGIIGLNDAIDRDVTNEVKGRQCIIEIGEREYEKDGQKKKAYNIASYGNAIFPLDDPAVVHVAKHAGALTLPGAKPIGAGGQVAAQPTATQQPAAAAGSAWSNV